MLTYSAILAQNVKENKTERAALAYASRFGWAVLPLHSIRDGACTCGKSDCPSPAKHPLIRNGVKDASRDPAVIAAWWKRWPFANVGIATGEASGFFVLDVDGQTGEESLADLEEKNGKLPATVEAITGSGGRHILFKCPSDTGVGNKVALAPGLDIRGDGGYIVAAPSLHVSGRVYTWELSSRPGEAEMAAAPAWLLDMIKPVGDTGQAGKSSNEWQRLATTPALEGERNGRLAVIAGHLLRRYVDPHLALELLKTFNAQKCSPPLQEDEVLRIAESVAGAELRRRRCG
ncbi:MAG: bifunctional DNA primase/polymerase [Dethiobacteraceae bacterium]|jgi:hypothetical protein